MPKPLKLEHNLPGCKGVFIGRQPRTLIASTGQHITDKYRTLNQLGAQPTKICQIIVPSDDRGRGHKTIAPAKFDSPVYAEGVVLTDFASGAFMQTRDCPTIFLSNEKNGRVLMTHAGKYAMRPPIDCGGCSANIVSTALQKVAPDHDGSPVHAWVVGGICPTCFQHDDEKGQAFVTPFLKTFGEEVFFGPPNMGQLDLHTLIRRILEGFGILANNIKIDTTCPREHAGCASYRGEVYDGDSDELANDVCVLRQ